MGSSSIVEGNTEDRCLVRTVANIGSRATEADFWVRPSAPLEKLFRAWCREHQVEESDAAFFCSAKCGQAPRLLEPAELAAETFLSSSSCAAGTAGPPQAVLHVQPKAAGSSLSESASFDEICSSSSTGTGNGSGRPDSGCSSGSGSNSSCGSSGEQIAVAVESVIAGDEDIPQWIFQISSTTPMSRLFLLWCQYQDIDVDYVNFWYESKLIRTSDTLKSLQLDGLGSGSQVTLRAQPSETFQATLLLQQQQQQQKQQPQRSTELLGSSSSSSKDSINSKKRISGDGTHSPSAASAAGTKTNVRITPQTTLGAALAKKTNRPVASSAFVIKLEVPFRKVFSAWCKQQGLSEESVAFVAANRRLNSEECGSLLQWPANGLVELQAFFTADVPGSVQQGPNAAVEERLIVQVTTIPSWIKRAPVLESVKFRMRVATDFGRMMTAWRHQASQYGLPREAQQVDFFLNSTQKLSEFDTPAMCGISDVRAAGIVHILASPAPPMAAAISARSKEEEENEVGKSDGPEQSVELEARMPSSLTTGSDAGKEGDSTQEDASVGMPSTSSDQADYVSRTDSRTSCEVNPPPLHRDEAQIMPIVVRVEAEAEEGMNYTDFKLNVNTPFLTLMRTWCTLYSIARSEVRFEFENQILMPDQTPGGIGWAASKGRLVVLAVPIDAPPSRAMNGTAEDSFGCASGGSSGDVQEAGQQIAKQASSPSEAIIAAAPVGSGSGDITSTAATDSPATSASSCIPANANANAKQQKVQISVQVTGEDGVNVLSFKMRCSSSLEKVMNAWSAHYGIARSDVQFLLGPANREAGAEIGPERALSSQDSPESLGIAPGGELIIRAEPADTPLEASAIAAAAATAATAAAAAATAAVDDVGGAATAQRVDDVACADLPALAVATPLAAGDGWEKDPQGLGELAGGASDAAAVVAAAAAAAAPGGGICMEGTQGAVVDRDPIGQGSMAEGDGMAAGTFAVSSGMTEAEVASATSTTTTAAVAAATVDSVGAAPAAAAAAAPGTVDVAVVARADNGDSVLPFKMKMSTSFSKLMIRWCAHHGVQTEQASFYDGDREILAEDTPETLGWNATFAGEERTVRAQPKGAPLPSEIEAGKGLPTPKGKARRKASEGASPPMPPSSNQSIKRAASAYSLFSKRRRVSLVEEKPELKTQLGELSKVVAAEWKQLTEEERQPYELEAVQDKQRKKAEVAAAIAAAAATAASALRPGGGGDPVANAPCTPPLGEVGLGSADARLSLDGPVNVVVLAQGSDGLSENRYTFRTTLPLSQIARTWCNHHEIPHDGAVFLYRGRSILAEESACSLWVHNRSAAEGAAGDEEEKEVTLTAVPSDSSEAAEGLRKSVAERGRIREALASVAKYLEGQQRPLQSSPSPSVAAEAAGAAAGSPNSQDAPAAPAPARAPPKKRAAATTRKASRHRPPRSRKSNNNNHFDDEEIFSDSSSENGGDGDDGRTPASKRERTEDDIPVRRSERLKSSPFAALSGSITIVHQPKMLKQKPPSTTTIRAGGEEGEKVEPASGDRMSYREYIEHDRDTQRRVDEAKLARVKTRDINGAESDEELSLALALSLSESQQAL